MGPLFYYHQTWCLPMKTLCNLLIPLTLLVAAGCLLVCPGCSCRPEAPSPTTTQDDAAEQDDDALLENTTAKNEQDETASTAPSADSPASAEGASPVSDNVTSSPAPFPTLAPRPAPVAETYEAGDAEGNSDAAADRSLLTGGPKVTTTPSEARTNADRLAARGKRALASGDVWAAYQYTLQAWQQLLPHQSDAACQQQIQQLTALLETIGQQANARFGGSRGTVRHKPVTIR